MAEATRAVWGISAEGPKPAHTTGIHLRDAWRCCAAGGGALRPVWPVVLPVGQGLQLRHNPHHRALVGHGGDGRGQAFTVKVAAFESESEFFEALNLFI